MATKADFSEAEWDALHRGVGGAGMLVSLSDMDLTDSWGEASAIAKYCAAQVTAGETQLMREIAGVHGTGFGLTSSPAKVRTETEAAIRSSIASLTAKAPDEVEPYRRLVLGCARAAAEAKGGVKPAETSAIDMIRQALGAA
jgi:hypothetical protein